MWKWRSRQFKLIFNSFCNKENCFDYNFAKSTSFWSDDRSSGLCVSQRHPLRLRATAYVRCWSRVRRSTGEMEELASRVALDDAGWSTPSASVIHCASTHRCEMMRRCAIRRRPRPSGDLWSTPPSITYVVTQLALTSSVDWINYWGGLNFL